MPKYKPYRPEPVSTNVARKKHPESIAELQAAFDAREADLNRRNAAIAEKRSKPMLRGVRATPEQEAYEVERQATNQQDWANMPIGDKAKKIATDVGLAVGGEAALNYGLRALSGARKLSSKAPGSSVQSTSAKPRLTPSEMNKAAEAGDFKQLTEISLDDLYKSANIGLEDLRYQPTSMERDINKAVRTYRNRLDHPKTTERAVALDKKYGTQYRESIDKQLSRDTKMFDDINPYRKRSDWMPDYIELDQNTPWGGYATPDGANSFFYGPDHPRHWRIGINATEESARIPGIISHEMKHVIDIPANQSSKQTQLLLNTLGNRNKVGVNTPFGDNLNKAKNVDWSSPYWDEYKKMFHSKGELPRKVKKEFKKQLGARPQDHYDYFTTGTEVEGHAMTNLREKMIQGGILKDSWDELTVDGLNKFMKSEIGGHKLRSKTSKRLSLGKNPYAYLIKDKGKFISRFNEAIPVAATPLILNEVR